MNLESMRKIAELRRDDEEAWDEFMHTAHVTYDSLLEIAEAASKLNKWDPMLCPDNLEGCLVDHRKPRYPELYAAFKKLEDL